MDYHCEQCGRGFPSKHSSANRFCTRQCYWDFLHANRKEGSRSEYLKKRYREVVKKNPAMVKRIRDYNREYHRKFYSTVRAKLLRKRKLPSDRSKHLFAG